MGGSAFTSAPHLLTTPRMPPTIYEQVKLACHARLGGLYMYVASPIEGPEKDDHGDVDIIVFLEREAVFPSGSDVTRNRVDHEPLKTIAAALGAEHVIYLKHSANMALPWPEADGHATFDTEKRRHVQVDVRIAQSLAEFQWWLFRHAHGDFWQLVGTTIRPLGLTVDEEALWIRIPEIERRDRKRAKVLLTPDPDEVLQFMGYKGRFDFDPGERLGVNSVVAQDIADDDTSLLSVWERRFSTVGALFAYVSTTRWFWVEPPAEPEQPPLNTDSDPDPNPTLRSNDRRRLKQRRVYARWAEEYIPTLFESARDGTFSNVAFNRLSHTEKQCAVREAAFHRWPAAREHYTARLEAFNLQVTLDEQKREILGYIRETVRGWGRDQNWTGVAVGALRKIILLGDESFGICPDAPLRDERGAYELEEVKRFVREKGGEVGDNAWEIMRARGRMSMENKARKRALLAEGTG